MSDSIINLLFQGTIETIVMTLVSGFFGFVLGLPTGIFPQIPRVLEDKEVALAIINNNFAAQAGLDPEKEGLFTEDKDSPYANLIVAREDNKNDEKVKKFVQAYQSPEVEAEAQKTFKEGAVKAW